MSCFSLVRRYCPRMGTVDMWLLLPNGSLDFWLQRQLHYCLKNLSNPVLCQACRVPCYILIKHIALQPHVGPSLVGDYCVCTIRDAIILPFFLLWPGKIHIHQISQILLQGYIVQLFIGSHHLYLASAWCSMAIIDANSVYLSSFKNRKTRTPALWLLLAQKWSHTYQWLHSGSSFTSTNLDICLAPYYLNNFCKWTLSP